MQRWRRVLIPVCLVVAVGGGIAVREAYLIAARQLPWYLSTRLSAAVGRPVTVGRVVFWPLGAFTVRDVRVLPQGEETGPPLVAEDARAYVAWLDLLFRHRLRVKEVHLDHAHLTGEIDLRQNAPGAEETTGKLLSLYGMGVERVGLHHSQADVTAILRSGERQPISGRDINAEADLHRNDFAYRMSAGRWTGGGLSARDIQVEGNASPQAITLKKSHVNVEGGTLAAKGTYVTSGGGVALQVQVNAMPLSNLAPQLGLPAEWNVKGDLTGTMDVGAASGELRHLHGTLRVARGSITHAPAVFPWQHATAQVDWTPAKAALRDIEVQGNGIRLRGVADVTGSTAQRFAERPFQAEGTMEATEPEAVASLAQLLTFNPPAPGQWDMQNAQVQFKASGVVGQLKDARAEGHLQARGLLVHLSPSGPPLRVASVQGDVTREATQVRLRNLRAMADGASATGEMTVVPTASGTPGHFAANGRLDLTSLEVFHQQVPGLGFWKWLNPATSASKGSFVFTAKGSTQHPERMTAAGTATVQEFSVTIPARISGSAWTVPLRSMSAQVRLQDNNLQISDGSLRSDLFTGSAQGSVNHLLGHGDVTGSMRIASDKWEQLPPLKGRVPTGLSGGRLVLEGTVPPHTSLRGGGPKLAAGELPLQGMVTLRGAKYRFTAAGKAKMVDVQDAAARFHAGNGRIDVPEYRLVTPLFRTSGQGAARQEAAVVYKTPQWLLHGEGVLTATDAGAAAHWWSGSEALTGGNLTARYTVEGSTAKPDQMSITGRVRLTDAQPHLPAGSLPLPASSTHINALTGLFSHRDGHTRFTDAVWEAPDFRLTGTGGLQGKTVDGSFAFTTPNWRALAPDLVRTLPLTGGELTASGHLHGPVNALRTAPFEGKLALRNARLASTAGAKLPIEGGQVDLATDVDGPLDRLGGAELTGSLSIRNALLPPLRAGVERLPIQFAHGRFHRVGQRVTLTHLVARTPGAKLTGEGELNGVGGKSMSHQFKLAASGPELTQVLTKVMPLPGKASGGVFTGTLTLSGVGKQPISQMDGQVDVRDASWLPPGQKTAFQITRMTGHMVRRGDTATLDGVELHTPGGDAFLTGKMTGLNTPGAARHDLKLKWHLEDASAWASRFLPVPGWFTGGTFTGDAAITGTPREPAATASGSFSVDNAGFLPPERFLGGPIHPISVDWARGVFTRAARVTRLRKLDLKTSVGTATGAVTSNDSGIARIRARGEISKLQALIDLWPGLTDRVKGGSGEMTLDLRGPLRRPAELAGTVNLMGRGGVLAMEDVSTPYGEEPFDELGMRLQLGGGEVRMDDVKMRGPKANLDGSAVVSADGRVTGKGKAWFTDKFTRTLIKPPFLASVARVFGFRQLKSDFKVDGSLRDARLHMGITKSVLWKLAIRKKVPEPLRKIATGDAPLWQSEGPPPSRVTLR